MLWWFYVHGLFKKKIICRFFSLLSQLYARSMSPKTRSDSAKFETRVRGGGGTNDGAVRQQRNPRQVLCVTRNDNTLNRVLLDRVQVFSSRTTA